MVDELCIARTIRNEIPNTINNQISSCSVYLIITKRSIITFPEVLYPFCNTLGKRDSLNATQ